ncbi:hypothetical protein LX87_03272 [Larkinella arboricola]|uniref:Uncharacterized protein n=1 Tax=Larkinella arboricola TaxID=643671 RepID=A0A327WVQ9_LARAB|nr:hypothetical protein [Larkinella arboricola]RAJ95525.1 hypothetical protein LX87_03272 [Larkinella arboricola]
MTNFFNKPKETVITGAFKTQTTIFSVTPTTRFERRCHILYESYNRLVEDGEKMLAADVLTIMKSVLDDEIKSLQASCVTNRE